jgi:sugar/nucleoside kinase (ribokinase family)
VVDVLVIGDANPDLVLRGDVVPRFGQAEQLLTGADLVLGGSGAIVAHGLAKLGRSVRLVAATAADPLGQLTRGWLTSAGVDTPLLAPVQAVGTGATIVLTRGEDPSDRAMLTFPGAIAHLSAEQVSSAFDAALDEGLRHVHVASYFLVPALAESIPDLLRRARRAGVTTSLDTNDDPARRWAGIGQLLPHVDLLLPNRAEVVALAEAVAEASTSDPLEAARALAAGGATIVVKDGAAGAYRVDPDGTVLREPGVPVEPVDTTGAGDTFDAAYLDAFLAGAEPETCLRRAARAGAMSTSAVGGTAGQPTGDQLETDERTPHAARDH